MHTKIDVKAVRRVMAEFDRIGDKAFYQKYGGGRPKRYFVSHPDNDQKLYPSAPIAQAALGWEDINGGYGSNYSACSMLARAGLQIFDAAQVDIVRHISAAVSDMAVSEREALVMTRVGQDILRAALIKSRGAECEITGVTDLALLRASHIKPWAACSTPERWDSNNAILLSSLWDAAFDKGLVSFDDDGEPIWSQELSKSAKRLLGKSMRSTFWPNDQQVEYLQWHRENIFQS